jgi:peptidoglycan L-alanyl-D-glutamate endopeptidase CwlK
MKLAATEFAVPIVWGGDWQTLKDGCHFELDRRVYPAASNIA